MQMTDIFADEAIHFDSTEWHDYTIIENDSIGVSHLKMQISREESEQIFSIKVVEKRTKVDVLLSVMKKIKFEIGLGTREVNMLVNSIEFMQNGINLKNQVSKQQNIYYYFSYGYKFNRNLSLNYLASSSFNNQLYYYNQQFDLNYLICRKQGGKQIFAEPSLGYSFVKSVYKIGTINAGEEVFIDGKFFCEKSHLYSGLNQQNISLGLNFKTRISPMFMILVGGNYNYPVTTSQGIMAYKNFFIYNKTAFEPYSSNFDYYEDGRQTNESSFKLDSWQLRLSLLMEL